jgi:hypothetical protein
MTPQELLKPRYKVIADYPNRVYEIGQILERGMPELEHFYSKYPHLFRKLEWWEERRIKIDLPSYVKVTTDHSSLFNGDVFKVKWWGYQGASLFCVLEDGKSMEYKYDVKNFLPATQSEYESFIKQQVK